MASFTCLVQRSPSQGQHSYSAYQFCLAALQNGHQIQQVFFYADAVNHGNRYLSLSSDEQNMQALWQQLSGDYQVPLIVCATVGARHGVLGSTEPELADSFSAGGLAEYMEAVAISDHLIQF